MDEVSKYFRKNNKTGTNPETKPENLEIKTTQPNSTPTQSAVAVNSTDEKKWSENSWNMSGNYERGDNIVYKRFDSSKHTNDKYTKTNHKNKYGDRDNDNRSNRNNNRNRNNKRTR